jgi:NADH-quinone oxidoreductase subunit L
MFLGAGVGAYVAAIFHLVTHAFFKACLFLGAGSVISRSGHTNDMRLYGGLKKLMPVTAATFLVSTLAISGFPLLSGFMSKDEILAKSLFSFRGSPWLWAIGTLGAVMTSFYMFRAYYMTFLGENRAPAPVRKQISESPRVMTGVLVALAIGAVVVGFIGIPEGVTKLAHAPDVNWFAHQLQPVVGARGVVAAAVGHGEERVAASGHPHEGEAGNVLREGARHPSYATEWGLFLLAGCVFLAGLVAARWGYGNNGARADAIAPALAFPRRLLHRKWYVDELYDRVVLQPFYAGCRGLSLFDQWVVDGAVNGTARLTLIVSQAKAAVDRWVVDGAVDGVGWLVRTGGSALRRLQSGYVQSYAAALVVGTFVLFAVFVLFAR